MTSPFSTIQNAIAFEEAKVPVLPAELWRQFILEHCLAEKTRITALFGEKNENNFLRVFCVLANDGKKTLQIGAAEFTSPEPKFPSLTQRLPEAHLFERELFEDFGILPEGHPWLKPLRKHGDYSFHKIDGEQIHEVAVGPVHAGIIEPGHFRFQCHGEKVLHLEIRLGYQHRGVEGLMVKADPQRRERLAESIAGDTVIGHALAYCHAIEGLSERSITPPRSQALRAVALELERVANHVGDLGALAADIGFLPASAYFGRLRGEFLNLLMDWSGNRYGRSLIRPGGVGFDLPPEKMNAFLQKITTALSEIKELAELFFSASSVLSRLEGTGVLKPEAARELGTVGITARASNLPRDIRHEYPTGLFRSHKMEPVKMPGGDVYARARIRSLECKRSLQFIRERLQTLPQDKISQPCGPLKKDSMIVSLMEGWRGEIAHIVKTGGEGEIRRYKIVDPSFHNWMALSVAMQNGQISDFPLCNKSFNLSYAGHDL